MPPVPPVHSHTIPSSKWRRLQISVASLGVALAVLAASIVLIGRADVQYDRAATHELPVLSHEHQGVGGGAEDATYLLQSFKPRVEHGTEDKASRASQDKDAAQVSSSKNLLESAWISLAGRSTLVTHQRVTNGKTVFLALLTLLCICCIGVIAAPAMKEALRRPSEPSLLRRLSADQPSPDVKGSMRQSLLTGPSPSTSSASSPDPADITHKLSQSSSPKPIPLLLNKGASTRFPPRIGVPLRQVAPFDPNANHEITIVAGRGTPLMWARVSNTPTQRLLQLSSDMDRREPEVTIVSSPLGALEIIGGGISFGFLEAERSGRCFVVHQGEYVMVVEGDSGTMDPEITVISRIGQVARLRCNDTFHRDENEPFIEIGICPGEDTVLIVAVVLAVMLLSPATWRPMRQA